MVKYGKLKTYKYKSFFQSQSAIKVNHLIFKPKSVRYVNFEVRLSMLMRQMCGTFSNLFEKNKNKIKTSQMMGFF